jgi:hypothetical protein
MPEASNPNKSFDWEAVKSDKYRQNYLGHSLMAPIGRSQESKNLLWYTKGAVVSQSKVGTDEITKLQEEIAMVRKKETDLLTSQQSALVSNVKVLETLQNISVSPSMKREKEYSKENRYNSKKQDSDKDNKNKKEGYQRRRSSRSRSPKNRRKESRSHDKHKHYERHNSHHR